MCALTQFANSQAKKTPAEAGVVSLFAVTHQGPAQGGKAGGGEPPERNLAKFRTGFKSFSN
jgi:hypothetical protein